MFASFVRLAVLAASTSANATGKPSVVQCQATEPYSADGCASLWGPRPRHNDPQVVVVSVFKDTHPAEQQRWIEHHLVMGATAFVLVDNTCDSAKKAATDAALSPYVSAGIVSHIKTFRCLDLPNISAFEFPRKEFDCVVAPSRDEVWRAGWHNASTTRPFASCESCYDVDPKAAMLSCALYRLPWLRYMHPASLFVQLDDDEYVTMPYTSNPNAPRPPPTLQTVAAAMYKARMCAFPLVWRLFGSSGHVCQPHGGLVKNFLSRAALPSEVETPEMIRDMKRLVEWAALNRQNPVFGMAKTIFLATAIGCNNHICVRCSDDMSCGRDGRHFSKCPTREIFHNESHTTDGHMNITIENTQLDSRSIYINHYAYQSKQHWAEKKARGRTAAYHAHRGGDVHPHYDLVPDHVGWRSLKARVYSLRGKRLRKCVAEMMGLPSRWTTSTGQKFND
uniref:Glycosyltransferase family 92 protein n=1 Tax=Chrysotila carterae TaxID=13221 RepID=A0A7S4C0I0_CHRCT